jgi:hypothetical protein
MGQVLDTGKSVVTVTAGLVVTLGVGVAALALLLNAIKVLLF